MKDRLKIIFLIALYICVFLDKPRKHIKRHNDECH